MLAQHYAKKTLQIVGKLQKEFNNPCKQTNLFFLSKCWSIFPTDIDSAGFPFYVLSLEDVS